MAGIVPECYLAAAWRCVTNTDGQIIGIAFDRPDGSVIRLALTVPHALMLADSIHEFVHAYFMRTNSHPESSSGSPSVDVSVQRECEKVAP